MTTMYPLARRPNPLPRPLVYGGIALVGTAVVVGTIWAVRRRKRRVVLPPDPHVPATPDEPNGDHAALGDDAERRGFVTGGGGIGHGVQYPVTGYFGWVWDSPSSGWRYIYTGGRIPPNYAEVGRWRMALYELKPGDLGYDSSTVELAQLDVKPGHRFSWGLADTKAELEDQIARTIEDREWGRSDPLLSPGK